MRKVKSGTRLSRENISASHSRNQVTRHARLSLASAIVVITVIALSLTVPAYASTSGRQPAAPDTKSAPVAVKPPRLPLQAVVQNLGATKYRDAYGGMTNSPTTRETAPPSHITIYVAAKAPDANQFISAIRSAAASAGSATSYSIVDVTHTWAQLNALTIRMARSRGAWHDRGINLGLWGPDPSSNKVSIHLASYSPAAAKALYTNYGSRWITVSTKPRSLTSFLGPKVADINPDQGRLNDTPPFYGGDVIFNESAGATCTGGFVMLGAIHPQNHWILTAGHCGTLTWQTNPRNPQLVGSTSTQYYSFNGGNTPYDVQTIGANAWGTVWGNDFTTYQPESIYTPGEGELVTTDGAITGEVHDVPVQDPGPLCGAPGGITTCGLAIIGSDTGPAICNSIDSGGPVFQRLPEAGPVLAVGLINFSNDTLNVCAITLLSSITNPTNTTLDTNPSG